MNNFSICSACKKKKLRRILLSFSFQMYVSFICIFLTAQRRALGFHTNSSRSKHVQGNKSCLSMVNKKIPSSQMSTLMNAISIYTIWISSQRTILRIKGRGEKCIRNVCHIWDSQEFKMAKARIIIKFESHLSIFFCPPMQEFSCSTASTNLMCYCFRSIIILHW